MGETILVYRVATLKSQTKLAIILDLKEDPSYLEMHSRIPPPLARLAQCQEWGGPTRDGLFKTWPKESPNLLQIRIKVVR